MKLKKGPKYLVDSDPWMLAEDIPDIDFQFSQLWLSSFVNDLEKTVGINYKKILCIYHGCNLKFYYGKKDSNDFAEHVLSLIISKSSFGEKINNEIRKHSTKLKKISKTINAGYLSRLSDEQLSELYIKLDKIHTILYSWGWLPNAVDMFHGNFTDYLKKELSKKMRQDQINEALVTFSLNPEKSIIDQEQDSFLRLVELKQKGNKTEFNLAMNKHAAKYFYFKHLWLGKEGVYDGVYYEAEVDEFIKSGQSARDVINNKEIKRKDILKKQKLFIRKFKISKKLQKIFEIYSEFSVTKVFRRDAQLFWAYKMDFLFFELSKRLKSPVIDTRFMLPEEIVISLRSGLNKKLAATVKERVKCCAYYAEKGIDLIFVGADAKKYEDLVKEKRGERITEIKGQAACLGKVTGIVRIVNSVDDMKKMINGEILVSIATNPDIVPAMKIAAAIVTEQGGITSHAAIVSRELNVPCVIGTKIATKVLKDGDKVEVDANKGIVKILK